MRKVRPAVLVSAVLAVGALALTCDDLLRGQPAYFSWPNAPEVGILLLLALVAATWWLARDTQRQSNANAWAKSALALTISLPLAWIATANIVWDKLREIPDGDMPDGLVERMNADVLQMQFAALLATLGVLACIAIAARRMHAGEDAGAP